MTKHVDACAWHSIRIGLSFTIVSLYCSRSVFLQPMDFANSFRILFEFFSYSYLCSSNSFRIVKRVLGIRSNTGRVKSFKVKQDATSPSSGFARQG